MRPPLLSFIRVILLLGPTSPPATLLGYLWWDYPPALNALSIWGEKSWANPAPVCGGWSKLELSPDPPLSWKRLLVLFWTFLDGENPADY